MRLIKRPNRWSVHNLCSSSARWSACTSCAEQCLILFQLASTCDLLEQWFHTKWHTHTHIYIYIAQSTTLYKVHTLWRRTTPSEIYLTVCSHNQRHHFGRRRERRTFLQLKMRRKDTPRWTWSRIDYYKYLDVNSMPTVHVRF